MIQDNRKAAEVRQRKQIEEDLKYIRKASILVRQAALRYLLETETQMYEAELTKMGKTFFIDRI